MCAATVFWAKGYTGLLLSICVYVSGFYLSTLNINMKCFLLFFFTHAPKESVTVDTVQHTLTFIYLSLYNVPM